MRILVSGASGFIGTPLTFFLQSQGHNVVPLARHQKVPPSDFDAVIHLAGEPLTLSRWSAQKKREILRSRTEGTASLVQCLSAASYPPKIFLSASAIGYYGDRGEEILTEESPAGHGFLSAVCRAWEEASLPLEKRGIRVVHARFGMVLHPEGGALRKMLLLYKLGLGGKLGSGRQWISWIAREDLIHALRHILHTVSLRGPVNVASPHPIRQAEFAHILAQTLHRPCLLSLPAFLLRLHFGLVADELILSSARVHPAKLLASNFTFDYPDLRSALFKAAQPI